MTYAKLFNEVHMVNAVGGIRLLRANHNPVVTSLSGLSMTVIQILLFLQGILREVSHRISRARSVRRVII